MLGPYPTEAVIAHARTLPEVKIVGGLRDFVEAQNTPPRASPALYVLREERGEPALGASGQVIQPIAATIKLILWMRHAGNAELAEASMSSFEKAVRKAFFGWSPSAECKPATIQASGADQVYGADHIRQLLMTSTYTQTRT